MSQCQTFSQKQSNYTPSVFEDYKGTIWATWEKDNPIINPEGVLPVVNSRNLAKTYSEVFTVMRKHGNLSLVSLEKCTLL